MPRHYWLTVISVISISHRLSAFCNVSRNARTCLAVLVSGMRISAGLYQKWHWEGTQEQALCFSAFSCAHGRGGYFGHATSLNGLMLGQNQANCIF